MAEPASRLRGARTALFAFGLAAAWFLWHAAPGVTFEDSGELAAAAATGGVAHPPGYPLFLLLGRAWIAACSPLTADPARALNLLSAVCAAGAVGLLALALRRLGAGSGAALAAALLLACSPTFAAQAVVTEVYAPAALCAAALVMVALTGRRAATPSGLLLGLGCAAHPGILLFAPLALAGVLRERASGTPLVRAVLRAMLGMLAGLSLFLYLPLAASGDPPVNWGEVTSFAAFREHVLRTQYGTGLERALGAQLAFLAEQLVLQWPLALGLALAGLVLGARRAPRAALGWLAATTAATASGLLLAVNYTMEPSTKARVAGAYVPLVLLVSALAGLGLGELERRLAARVPRAAARAILVAAVLALALASGPRTLAGAVDQRHADEAQRYASEVLGACPPNALLVVSERGYSDVLYFPLLYAQVVHGARPDVLVLERESLELAWQRAQLARRRPELAPALARLDALLTSAAGQALGPRERRMLSAPFLEELLTGPRPVVSVAALGERVLGERVLAPGPVLWELVPAGAAPPPPAPDPPAWTWLPDVDRDPWIAHLRTLARERDLARAAALATAGFGADAARLHARWPQ